MWMNPAFECDTCGEILASPFDLRVEGELIGEFCAECHATMKRAIDRLLEDESLDVRSVVAMEREAVVELCRESAVGEPRKWKAS